MIINNTVDKKTIIKSKYLNENIYNLLDKTFTIPLNGFDFNVFDVSKEYIARPDLISLDAYGDTSFQDVICKLNGISNPFELNEGMQIVLPTPECIQEFVFSPQYIENENHETTLPQPKKAYEKRAPNDAVINDPRFKIDPTTGVVIY